MYLRSRQFLSFCAAIVLIALGAQAQQPGIPTTGFAGLDQYRASRIAVFTDDYGQLARYRDANAALKPPAPGEKVLAAYRIGLVGNPFQNLRLSQRAQPPGEDGVRDGQLRQEFAVPGGAEHRLLNDQ